MRAVDVLIPVARAITATSGVLISGLVDRSRWADPRDRRVMIAVVLLAVLMPTIAAVTAVRSTEAANAPRVIGSAGGLR